MVVAAALAHELFEASDFHFRVILRMGNLLAMKIWDEWREEEGENLAYQLLIMMIKNGHFRIHYRKRTFGTWDSVEPGWRLHLYSFVVTGEHLMNFRVGRLAFSCLTLNYNLIIKKENSV